jgi:hypothetical protein
MSANGFATTLQRNRRSRRTRLTTILGLAVVLAGPPALAGDAHALHASRDPGIAVDSASAWSTTGWPALAGLGLAAIAMGAASARRPRQRASSQAGVPSMPADRLPMLTVAPEPMPMPAGASLPRPGPEGCEPPPATAEARPYLALHHVDVAIDRLRRHVDDGPRATPVAWLMLLDLYRTHGREQAFRDLAPRFHARFNAETPQWSRYPPAAAEPGLEAFPRLIKEITLCWGTHECSRLLDRLLYDNRSGRRMGFSLNAYNDLLALRALSNEVVATIEADFAEEAALRTAFAAASADLGHAAAGGSAAQAAPRRRSPGVAAGALTAELEAQLEDDLRQGTDGRSPLEVEHPALAGMLAREWGNSALAVRLCEILAQGVDSEHPLSGEAVADLATLKLIAGDLASSYDERR